ncbi:ATP-binding protein [Streptomyces tateyamensis]|uniref:ATP-binding protein n=1 Tax=Streptomyces tateyamensis TaxID=565073 RepID=UPI0011B4EC4F|nr:ATP-binding protein [Streptomyces tateyamensis]
MGEDEALRGRAELLDRCRAALADGGLLLTGPAGIGKSAVLEQLALEADRAGYLCCGPTRRPVRRCCRTWRSTTCSPVSWRRAGAS